MAFNLFNTVTEAGRIGEHIVFFQLIYLNNNFIMLYFYENNIH